ncbi:signal recognition particle protein [candidate division KSB1 bacterium]
MFNELSNKLESVLKKLRGEGKITEKNIDESLRIIRRVLLEADVNYKVAKNFISKVKEKAIGREVLRSVTAAQQIVKIIHDEMTDLFGEPFKEIQLKSPPPTVIMVVGLQGSGKTTFCAKLAYYFQKRGRKPLLASADVYRPAAREQLSILGKSLNIMTLGLEEKDPVRIADSALSECKNSNGDILILDTAGRLQIDEDMMAELEDLKSQIKPDEIFFVADGMTGQDAVNTASTFKERIDYSGVVLTKLDGDTRGGAALSIRSVTGKPIKFISMGEKVKDLEPFHPERMASRILGMGDIVSLVEKAQETIDDEQAAILQEKIKRAEFTFEDFKDQLNQIKNMGSFEQILGMIPGANKLGLKGMKFDENAITRTEAIINSMTIDERDMPRIINGSRRSRIARGSGTSVQEVNKLLNQFFQMQKMMKNFSKSKFNKQGFAGNFFG